MMVGPGCGAVVAHVLWEHEVVGSNPTTPTTVSAPFGVTRCRGRGHSRSGGLGRRFSHAVT